MKLTFSTFRNTLAGVSLMLLMSCGQKPAATAEQTTAKDSIPPPAAAQSARPVHWGYGGDVGPSTWSTLSPSYAMCAEGKHQSPVNIVKTDAKGGSNWNLDYSSTS